MPRTAKSDMTENTVKLLTRQCFSCFMLPIQAEKMVEKENAVEIEQSAATCDEHTILSITIIMCNKTVKLLPCQMVPCPVTNNERIFFLFHRHMGWPYTAYDAHCYTDSTGQFTQNVIGSEVQRDL